MTGGLALVADIILDREQILVVNRNGVCGIESFALSRSSHRAADLEFSGTPTRFQPAPEAGSLVFSPAAPVS